MPTNSTRCIINVDLAKVFRTKDKTGLISILGWGDEVDVINFDTLDQDKHVQIRLIQFTQQKDGSIKPSERPGFIVPGKALKPSSVVIPRSDSKILKVDFVDVQQGDGSVIETPDGKIVLIDGGDTRMFARYLANRLRATTEEACRKIDCIVVTHGDADHFLGLTEIHKSERDPKLKNQPWKRLFIYPERVYHNGLVKRPGKLNGRKLKDVEMLGATKTLTNPKKKKEKVTIITGLVDDLLAFPATEMNAPFQKWQAALQTYNERAKTNGQKAPIEFRRLQKGDGDAFDFLGDEIKVEVLAPLLEKIGTTTGLRFLGDPPKGPRVGHESLGTDGAGFSGQSASHTINGHSVIFRLSYGKFRFLFTGDLNDQAGRALVNAHKAGKTNLEAEVFKVPHHGSADFSGAFLQAVSPIVSVVSSGDDNQRKEFVHPRATIMGALGKFSRVDEPLIFVTELVAFFETLGNIRPECHKMKSSEIMMKDGVVVLEKNAKKPFFAFRRAAFGIVMVRTDGSRMLVYTNSGQVKMKEAYAYQLNSAGEPEPAQVRQA